MSGVNDAISIWISNVGEKGMVYWFLPLITSFNISNRDRRCELYDSFETHTLYHMLTMSDCLVNQRTEFVNELYRSCEYCYEK